MKYKLNIFFQKSGGYVRLSFSVQFTRVPSSTTLHFFRFFLGYVKEIQGQMLDVSSEQTFLTISEINVQLSV